MDLVLNNLQRLICHKTQQTKQVGLGGHLVVLTPLFFLTSGWVHISQVVQNNKMTNNKQRVEGRKDKSQI